MILDGKDFLNCKNYKLQEIFFNFNIIIENFFLLKDSLLNVMWYFELNRGIEKGY